MEVASLKTWANDVLIPKAELAFTGEGEFSCGDWCGFCRAANRCRKRSEEKLALAKEEFKLPPLLSDEEIEEILPKLEDLTKWADNLKAYAADAAIRHGHHWNGYKIVASRTNRKYKDEKAVSEIAISNGYEDIYRKSLIPLTEMEKLMEKETFKKLLSDQIYKPEGKHQSWFPNLISGQQLKPSMTNLRRSIINNTKGVTGTVRLSYFHGFEPVSINGEAEKYSTLDSKIRQGHAESHQ